MGLAFGALGFIGAGVAFTDAHRPAEDRTMILPVFPSTNETHIEGGESWEYGCFNAMSQTLPTVGMVVGSVFITYGFQRLTAAINGVNVDVAAPQAQARAMQEPQLPPGDDLILDAPPEPEVYNEGIELVEVRVDPNTPGRGVSI